MVFFKKSPFREEKINKKWSGKQRLVVSLDIGATHTAVAVAILTPGSIPAIIHVSRWPGQEDRLYEQKVPTVVLYDRYGQVMACGAEALSRQNLESADKQGWTLAKNFKLRLHPAAVVEKNKLRLDDLPPGADLEKIYTDFLQYVLNHTRAHLNTELGRDPWSDDAEVILAHPNGWGVHEQDFLLQAAISAELIPDTELARSKQLLFVEEAEASARYCISAVNSPAAAQFKKGNKFIVCDAGGSTVDISAYEITSISSDRIKLAELQVPGCVGAGGLHVDDALRQHLEAKLEYSEFSGQAKDLIRDGVRDFEQHGKRKFNSETGDVRIEIGWRTMNSTALNISHGAMQIRGTQVEGFFSHCISETEKALATQMKSQGIKHIILTGGLGESRFVRERLQAAFGDVCLVVVANSANSKAVAFGALMLGIGDEDAMVTRMRRSWATWSTNFSTLLRSLV